MTNKELGNAIRKELKAAGITSKDVSVRVRDSLYDTAVNIKIKNPKIKKSKVEEIAKKYQSVDHDERTYEILAGGNTYIFVDYEYGVVEEAAAELLPIAEMVLNNKGKYSGHKIADNGTKSVNINHYEGNEWILFESDNKETGVYAYRPTYWIKCANDLAVAMWRFKNLGTIYA